MSDKDQLEVYRLLSQATFDVVRDHNQGTLYQAFSFRKRTKLQLSGDV